MTPISRKRILIVCTLTALLTALALASCGGLTSPQTDEAARTTSLAVVAAPSTPGLTTTNLQLTVSENACDPKEAQEYFEVTNGTTSGVPLSSIQIKYWIYDTTGIPLAGQVWFGGCVRDSAGTCLHPVSGVTAITQPVASACGPSASQQANWEITVSTTDSTVLAPGETWGDVQTAINLTTYAEFSPGSSTWFSPCGILQPFQLNPYFGLYVGGDLVDTLGITAPSCRAPQGANVLGGNITPASVGAPIVGPVPPDTPMAMTIGLPVPDPQGLQAFIDTVSDPASTQYGQYLTPQSFGEQFGSPNYPALVAWAQSAGLSVKTYANNLEVTVSGTAATFGTALYVNMVQARRPDGTIFFAPDRQPSLNLTVDGGAIPVQGIDGLNNYFRPTPALLHVQSLAAAAQATQSSANITLGAGAYTSKDFRGAYLTAPPGNTNPGFDCTPYLGDGQTVALVEFDGFFPTDIVSYAQQTGLTGNSAQIGTLPQSVVVLCPDAGGCPDGAPLTPSGGNGTGEVSLDIEMVLAMAPNAQVDVFEGSNSGTGIDAILADIANNYYPAVRVISDSWYRQGPNSQTSAFQFAAQGQSFFVVSQDNGAYQSGAADTTYCSNGAGTPPPSGGIPPLEAVTIVGGTAFLADAGSPYAGETTWDILPAAPGYVGSGGGLISGVPLPFAQQTYQQKKLADNPAWTPPGVGTLPWQTTRNSPDVAAAAYDVLFVTSNLTCPDAGVDAGDAGCGSLCPGLANDAGVDGGPTCVSANGAGFGTSAAAPLWAGFTAVMNEFGLGPANMPALGYLNPLLYRLAVQDNYGSSFHDVTSGINTNECGFGFPADVDYDLATGLGSPQCLLMTNASRNRLPPQLTVTITNMAFQNSGSNLGNCPCAALPDDENPADTTITCSPINENNTISTTSVTVSKQVWCGNNHGAWINVTCSGTGNYGDNRLNGGIQLAISDTCGTDDWPGTANGQTAPFTLLGPGKPTSLTDIYCNGRTPCSVQSCWEGFSACGSPSPCCQNNFSGNFTVENTGGY